MSLGYGPLQFTAVPSLRVQLCPDGLSRALCRAKMPLDAKLYNAVQERLAFVRWLGDSGGEADA